jgi:DNA-binding LacI/PurR family transcriptional regulator
MKDVATRAGVSRALVSIVFRGAAGAGEETRGRVLAAAEELGYVRDQSARSLRTGRSYQLGVVFDSRDDFHTDLLDACYRAADDAGYELLLSASTPRRSQERALETLVAARVLGIVVLGARAAPRLPRASEQVPLAVVGHHEGAGVEVVASDEERGIHDAVGHLVGLGHRRITCIEATGHQGGLVRARGYRRAMAAHGLTEHVQVVPGAFTQSGGVAAATELVTAGNLPTAVVAANDLCAVGVLQVLRSAGVDVPGRVSVVGFDGTSDPAVRAAGLTTVVQDVDALAARVVQVLAEGARGGDRTGARHVVPTRLVVGATTGPAPAG